VEINKKIFEKYLKQLWNQRQIKVYVKTEKHTILNTKSALQLILYITIMCECHSLKLKNEK